MADDGMEVGFIDKEENVRLLKDGTEDEGAREEGFPDEGLNEFGFAKLGAEEGCIATKTTVGFELDGCEEGQQEVGNEAGMDVIGAFDDGSEEG